MKQAITELEVLGLVPFGHIGPVSRFFALRLSCPDWKNWQPGQFVMLRPKSFGLELPLGRPFSICHMTKRHLICFFKVSGHGTELLAQLSKGEKICAWGPLGNGFVMEMNKPTLLLAEGMGIVPFVGYVNRHPQPWSVSMLFGHHEPLGCFPVDSINERVQVDSICEHDQNTIDNLIFSLQEKIHDCAAQKGVALACGPDPFLRTVKRLAMKAGLPLQISLQSRMACGIGACFSCACLTTEAWSEIETRKMPVPVCTRGPVFWADQVEF